MPKIENIAPARLPVRLALPVHNPTPSAYSPRSRKSTHSRSLPLSPLDPPSRQVAPVLTIILARPARSQRTTNTPLLHSAIRPVRRVDVPQSSSSVRTSRERCLLKMRMARRAARSVQTIRPSQVPRPRNGYPVADCPSMAGQHLTMVRQFGLKAHPVAAPKSRHPRSPLQELRKSNRRPRHPRGRHQSRRRMRRAIP